MTNSKFLHTNEVDNETWDILFLHRIDNVGNYLNSKGSDEDMPKIGSSTKREEIEHVGTLETSETPVEKIPLPVAPTKTPDLEIPSTTEATTIEHVTTAEPIFGKVVKSEVNITTSTSACNNYSVLN